MEQETKQKPEGYVFGRPTLYKPEYCEMLIKYGERGNYEAQFCADLGISLQCFNEWVHKYPDFGEAKRSFDAKIQAFMEKLGFNGMAGIPIKFKTADGKDVTTNPQRFNGTIWAMFMKNKHGYKDRQDITTNDQKIESGVVIYRPEKDKE